MAQVVAFIGLGIMGGRMAKNVLKAGHHLRAYNRTAAKTEEVRKPGATVAASPRGGVGRKPQAKPWPEVHEPHTRRPAGGRGGKLT